MASVTEALAAARANQTQRLASARGADEYPVMVGMGRQMRKGDELKALVWDIACRIQAQQGYVMIPDCAEPAEILKLRWGIVIDQDPPSAALITHYFRRWRQEDKMFRLQLPYDGRRGPMPYRHFILEDEDGSST